MKNLNYIIRKTAMDLDLPEEKVRPVIEQYWNDIYTKMLKGLPEDKTTLFARGIGSFTVSKFKLNKFILKQIKKVKTADTNPKLLDKSRKDFRERHLKKLEKSLVYRNLLAEDYAKKLGTI